MKNYETCCETISKVRETCCETISKVRETCCETCCETIQNLSKLVPVLIPKTGAKNIANLASTYTDKYVFKII